MVRHDDLGAPAELVQAFLGGLGAFDFDIHRLRPATDGLIEHGHLVLDAAVELSVILVAPAGGQDQGVGELVEEAADGGGALDGLVEEVETKLEKRLTRLSLATGVGEQARNVRQAQRDAYARERPGLHHCREFPGYHRGSGAPRPRRATGVRRKNGETLDS